MEKSSKFCTKFILMQGDIFASPSCHLVNPVNTMGVAGKGLAKQFKNRYPFSYAKYQAECKEGNLKIGQIFSDTFWEPQLIQEGLFDYVSPTASYAPQQRMLTVHYFPTKIQWYQPSRIEFVQQGLKTLAKLVQKEGILDLAIPALGCGAGQLNWQTVLELIKNELKDIGTCCIYLYEPKT